jgi:hypothetical protein
MSTREPGCASAPSLLSRFGVPIQMLGTLIALTLPTSAPGELPRPPAELSSVEARAVAAQPGDSLLLIVGDRITVARVDRARVWCRDVRLRLDGEHLRGRVSGQSVELEMNEARVSGKIGSQPVSLVVERFDGALRVRGRFGARAIDEALTPRAISAEIGPCRYELRLARNEYEGQVTCGGQPEGVRLRIPATLAARGDVELAALLTAILAR